MPIISYSQVQKYSLNLFYENPNDSVIELIDSLKEISPSIEFGGGAMNKVVFWGRTFGVKQFGIEPYLMYKTGKGLYFYIAENYWSAMTNKFAKTDVGLGYERQFTDRFYASLGYERWFFHNGTSDVRKALINYVEADLNYDFDFLSFEPTFYLMFGKDYFFQTDLTISGDYYLFSFLKTGEIYLKPQFITTFANQTFLPLYSSYPANYIKNQSFKLIDFELILPLSCTIKNSEIAANFHYNVPVKAPNETVHPFYYFSLQFTHNFYLDHKKINTLYKDLK